MGLASFGPAGQLSICIDEPVGWLVQCRSKNLRIVGLNFRLDWDTAGEPLKGAKSCGFVDISDIVVSCGMESDEVLKRNGLALVPRVKPTAPINGLEQAHR